MNAELKQDGTLALTIRRVMPFPREFVFEAWLKKEHLAKWMGPTPDINLSVTDIEAKEGGKYRFGFEEKGCSETTSFVYGEFLEIVSPEKLVFTWTWEDPLPEAGVQMLVTVNFTEVDGGTEITLLHQKFMDEASCERHREGWAGTLAKMESYFHKVSL